MNPTEDLISEAEAAAMLGISVHTLRNDRSRSKHVPKNTPPFYKIGLRVLYSRSDLAAFISACRVDPTRKAS